MTDLAKALDHRAFPYVWRWRKSRSHPIDRWGQRCRVLARGKKNSILVEFEDGHRIVTAGWAIRRAPS